MRVAAQLGETENLRESRAEVGEPAASGRAILLHCAGPQRESQRLEVGFKDVFEARPESVHEIGEELKRVRFSMARAYSRQTSCGASWT